MPSLLDLNYVQAFHKLPISFYTPVKPKGLTAAKLVLTSSSCADLLGIDEESLQSDESLSVLSGNALLSNWQPVAMKYTGHQFGHYNPQLGDGRGLLLAQVENPNNELWDLHLKGAGLTPYSRQGDGRAVLRSSIREFLCSEALAALSIPTTRALCVVDSETPVYRETAETGAMIIRVAQSHIRFGHFEFCSFGNQHEDLKTLCDFVINQHYPELKQSSQPYADFFARTLEKTAKLLAHWQSIGFCHGVMNTDNMSILGDTFDFGPFAFLDDYDPEFICNHSDDQGRYRFAQQPNIANWNLAVLAQALLPLVDKDILVPILDSYPKLFKLHYTQLMAKKLGLSLSDSSTPITIAVADSIKVEHEDIINETINMLTNCRLDYTYFFRKLADIQNSETHTQIRNMALDINLFDQWFTQYQAAIEKNEQSINDSTRSSQMNLVNPKYILRNYLAQNAIQAAQAGDYSVVRSLHSVLQNPFDEQPEFNHLSDLPPDWGKKLEISCSS